jgi:hypothetical protein
MACIRMPRRFAGDLGFVHNLDEIFPLRIPKQVLKVAGKPEFDAAIGLLSVRFEMLGQRVNQPGLHVHRPRWVARGGEQSGRRKAIKKRNPLYQGPRF